MKYYFKCFLLVFIIFATGCNRGGKNQVDNQNDHALIDDFSSKIDSLIQTTSPRKFNGVVLITQNGITKYTKASGYSDFDDKTPISTKDNFRIQSNSKQITAVLILKEVEKGNIDLESPIKAYLPDLTQSWADTVTVHHLLNMSSGIIALDKPLIFRPGKGYRYSNPGYGLLGRIIEHATGKTYVEAANGLLESLGMRHSYCYEIGKANAGLVNGYWTVNDTISKADFEGIGFTEETWKSFIPTGGIISNVTDLNLWDTKLHGGEILKAESYKLMTTPSNRGKHAAFGNDTIGYGYGLRIHDQHAVRHLGHGGRGFGFVCLKFYIPEKDVDVIIWENVYSRDDDAGQASIVYHFENEIRKIVLNSILVK